MIKSKIFMAILALMMFGGLTQTLPAYAQGGEGGVGGGSSGSCQNSDPGFFDFPTWYTYLETEEIEGRCSINMEFPEDLPKILLAAFEIILRISGLLAVGFVMVGAFQYMLSQGDPEKTKGARRTIVNSLVGLAIAIFSTAMVSIIARSIT